MKKIISAVLAVMMLAGVMTGCKKTPGGNGKETETAYESTKETEKEKEKEKEEKKTVAKYTKKVYTYSDGDHCVTEYEYDEKGNEIKETETFDDGRIFLTEREYNDDGKVIKRVSIDDKGNQSITETEYVYDANGNLIKEYVNCDGEQEVGEFEYDKNGNLIKKVYTYSYGYQSIEEYRYDENGNLIFESSDGCDTEYVYDENGNLIKKWYSDEELDDCTEYYDYEYYEGNKVKKKHSSWVYGYEYQYEYDDKGNKLKKTVLRPGGYNYVTEYEYDGNGNVVKEARAYVGIDDYAGDCYEYEYDDKGNVIKETHAYVGRDDYAGDCYEYEYDDKGNVIKETYTYPDGDYRITAYEYEYEGNNIVTVKEEITISNGYHEIKENKYEYDEKGRMTKETDEDYMTVEYEYNDKENKVRETLTYIDGEEEELYDVVEWTLDGQGRKIKGKILYSVYVECGDSSSDDYDDYYYENEYDENGNLIKEFYPTKYYGGMAKYIYKYNEHGDVIKKEAFTDSKYDIGEVTEYDINGNKIKETETYFDGEQDITEWEYDGNGNLIKETRTIGGKVDHTAEYSGYVYFEVDDAE